MKIKQKENKVFIIEKAALLLGIPMLFNKKKETVEFYSTNVNALYQFPIEPAKETKFSWIEKLKNNLKNNSNVQDRHTMRCPGIFTPFKYGFILKTWYDFKITVVGEDLHIAFPSEDLFLNTQEKFTHDDPDWLVNNFEDHIIDGKKCHPLTIKISTSWFVHLPDGWQLMQSAVPYSTETRFTAATGIYDPLINNQITVPLLWHNLQGETIIKAGTPLCYLLPVKVQNFDFSIREATEREFYWEICNFRRNNSFVRNYESMKQVTRKFFNR